MYVRSADGGARGPTTLREVNGLGFLHRDRVRFRAGASDLLGIALEPRVGEGIVVDVGGVDELRAVTTAPGGSAAIGAFAPLELVMQRVPEIVPAGTSAAQARLRLALLDARVVVLGIGRNRSAPVDRLELLAHELPATIEVAAPKPGFGLAERRRATRDGDASHAIGVSVALRISVLGRYEGVRIVVDVDGELFRASAAEERLDKKRVEPESLNEAARLATAALEIVDARTSSIARSLAPLAFAALRDAELAARASIAAGPQR